MLLQLLALRDDLILNKVAEGRDALGMAQFLGIGEVDGHVSGFDIGQNGQQVREILRHVVRQHADPKIVQNALQARRNSCSLVSSEPGL